MAKKLFLIFSIILSSFVLCASPNVLISITSSESTGYTGFLGTDSWTRHRRVGLQTGLTIADKWASYLCFGADFNEEIKSFTPFASLSDSFSLRCGVGGKYSEDSFAIDLSAGLRVTDMELDHFNKYADVFFEVSASATMVKFSDFRLSSCIPVCVAFNGCGCNLDLGIGVMATYRANSGGRNER